MNEDVTPGVISARPCALDVLWPRIVDPYGQMKGAAVVAAVDPELTLWRLAVALALLVAFGNS